MDLERMVRIPDKMFFNIADAARLSGVKSHVLRYWETQFPQLSPEKDGGGRRQYTRTQIETVLLIKDLLYVRRFSIEGARKHMGQLKRHGELKQALVPRVALDERAVDALSRARDRLMALEKLCRASSAG